MAQLEVLLKNSVNAARDAYNAARNELLTPAHSDVDVWSYDLGVLPDATGLDDGTIGAYFTNAQLLQKLRLESGAWVEIGSPVSTKQYVDDKSSLSVAEHNDVNLGAKTEGRGLLFDALGNLVESEVSSDTENVNALGSITGATAINLANGTVITATLTGSITLSFTGLPSANQVYAFTLQFSGAQQITYPAGTVFAGGSAPTITGPDYEIPCSIDSSGVLRVYGVIDEVA